MILWNHESWKLTRKIVRICHFCSCSQTYFKGVYIICIGNFLVMSKRREEKKCTESYEQENQFHNQCQCNIIEVELKGLTHNLSEDKRRDHAGWCTMYILQNIVKVGVYLLYITAACLQLCGGEQTPTQHCPEYQHCMEPSHVRSLESKEGGLVTTLAPT